MGEKMKTVISASRRTDLPAFYYDWLQTALQTGQAELTNPRFPQKTYQVDLRPEKVHSVVLWSKNLQNVLKKPMYLENYNLYFQYTVNNYDRVLEPGVPEYKESLKTLGELLKKYRPEQFNMRFDPVIISTAGELSATPVQPGRARLQCFTRFCRDLRALGMRGCRITTSYIVFYYHVKKRLAEAGISLSCPDDRLLPLFFARMAEIAADYGFGLYSCSIPFAEQVPGLKKGSCIDGELLTGLFGGRVSKAKDTGQRITCGCSKSTDVGSYAQICGAGCLYCYAKSSIPHGDNDIRPLHLSDKKKEYL